MKLIIYSLVFNPKPRRPEGEPDKNPNRGNIGLVTTYLILLSLLVIFLSVIIAYIWMKYLSDVPSQTSRLIDKPGPLVSLLFGSGFIAYFYYSLRRIQNLPENLRFIGIRKKYFRLFGVSLAILISIYLSWIFFNKNSIQSSTIDIFTFTYYFLTGLYSLHIAFSNLFIIYLILLSRKTQDANTNNSSFQCFYALWHFLVFVWMLILGSLAIF